MGQLYAVHDSKHFASDIFEKMLKYLSPQKQERIRNFHRDEDAFRSLTADLLTRMLACRNLSLRNEELEFSINAWGKPEVSGAKQYHYNVSHSMDWVVCAVDNEPVGVDIEYIAPIDLSIAKHFFTISEVDYLSRMSQGEQLGCFYDLWTLKESHIKAQGMGLSMPLNSFSILPGEDGLIRLETPHEHKLCYFRQYELDPGYKFSLCMYNNEFPAEVQVLTLSELISQFQLYGL